METVMLHRGVSEPHGGHIKLTAVGSSAKFWRRLLLFFDYLHNRNTRTYRTRHIQRVALEVSAETRVRLPAQCPLLLLPDLTKTGICRQSLVELPNITKFYPAVLKLLHAN